MREHQKLHAAKNILGKLPSSALPGSSQLSLLKILAAGPFFQSFRLSAWLVFLKELSAADLCMVEKHWHAHRSLTASSSPLQLLAGRIEKACKAAKILHSQVQSGRIVMCTSQIGLTTSDSAMAMV